MKTLFNIYPTAFDCPGGGEVQLMQTSAALTGLGHEVLLYDQWKPQFGEAKVVHHFSVYGGSGVFCTYAKQNKNKPLAISPILWPSGDVSNYPMGEIQHLMNLADVLLPNSILEAEALSQVFKTPIEKFSVSYNGVNEIFCSNDQPDGSHFREKFEIDEPFVLNVGNIETRKNQISLAKAAAHLDKLLVIAGNVRSADYLNAVLTAGAGRVKFVGYLPHESLLLRSAYRACDVFALPSLLETPGLSALEAAVMGAKIVITREGSAKEYFGSDVLYVDPSSQASITDALADSFTVKQNNVLEERIKSRFTWQHTAEQVVDAYQRII